MKSLGWGVVDFYLSAAEVIGVTFLTPAPVPKKVTPDPAPALQLIGNLHSQCCLHSESLKAESILPHEAKELLYLPLANMDVYCHAFSAGKQVVFSCLCWSPAGFP